MSSETISKNEKLTFIDGLDLSFVCRDLLLVNRLKKLLNISRYATSFRYELSRLRIANSLMTWKNSRQNGAKRRRKSRPCTRQNSTMPDISWMTPRKRRHASRSELRHSRIKSKSYVLSMYHGAIHPCCVNDNSFGLHIHIL
jgi:hypothetical protein